MRKLIAICLCSVLALAATSGRAEIVRGLYSAQVPVADQSAGALTAASREALSQVLVKISGSTGVLRNPDVAASMREARKHVLQYAYVRDNGEDGGGLEARFEFDDSWVVEMLTRAGEPLWTANRPLVLVWLVAEDAGGRYFVNHDSSPELAGQVLEAFARRGVPVQLPLFDLADSTALSTEEAWRLYGPALQAASTRYDVENFIAGRMVALSTGSATGDWSYFYEGDRIDRTVTAADAADFVERGVTIVAEDMAARYAVAPTLSDQGGLTLSFQGVQRYADYAGVVAWLEGLELIEHANVERISGDRIELRLQASAGAGQLASIIELNERLIPVPPQAPHIQLSYQWQN